MADVQLACPSSAVLGAAEAAELGAVPDAAYELAPQMWCELEAGHPGRHVALAQAQDAPTQDQRDDADVNHWAWWDNDGSPELTTGPSCPAASREADPDADLCILPAEHAAGHLF